MFKLAIVAVCSFGLGVALMDSLQDRSGGAPRAVERQAVLRAAAPGPVLLEPVLKPDATLRHCTTSLKCGPEIRYHAGMVRK